jgi:hypothetical protein
MSSIASILAGTSALLTDVVLDLERSLRRQIHCARA